MSDLIDRQAAIDALNKLKIYRPLDSDRYVISDCLNKIVNLPSAQPETHEERTETHACDLISRQAAIDALDEIEAEVADGFGFEYEKWRKYFCDLPPAQPERIIHCKDCEWWTKQECSPQGRCALSGMYPTGGWFCGNARRREVTT